jgi:hypothetical protein
VKEAISILEGYFQDKVDNMEGFFCCGQCEKVNFNLKYYSNNVNFCSSDCLEKWRKENSVEFSVELLDRGVHCNFRVLALDCIEAKEIALNQIKPNVRNKARVVFIKYR